MSVTSHFLSARLVMAFFAFPASLSLANAQSVDRCGVFASEAARRSGLPLDMVLRVMRAESGTNPRALSPKGAMGCMQIMPATWATLSMRYGLGSDPFDARMNMIGGALYLADLRTRFGIPGAYAAYNAGPNRYERFSANGVPLPAETVAYASRLGGAGAPIIKADAQARWQEAALFVARSSSIAKSAPTSPSAVVGSSDAGFAGGVSTSDPTLTGRIKSMFPLPVRNVALPR